MRRGWALLLLALWIGGCAAPPGRRVSVSTGLDTTTQREATVLYRELLRLDAAGSDLEVQSAGIALLDGYPGAAEEDHVLLLTAQAALRNGDERPAMRLLERLARFHPDSPYAGEGAAIEAGFHRERGDWAQEADALVRFYSVSLPEDPRRETARVRLRELLESSLSTDEIDALARAHPRSPIGSTAHWLATWRMYQENVDPSLVAERLEYFLREYPRSRYAEEARGLMASLTKDFGIQSPDDLHVAAPDRIGLLAPLSGEYAALGQAMFDGALLALEEHNRATGGNLSLVALDTRGDEVVAVQSARRLIEEDDVIAIVGALLSSTTVAVATLCEERGVPLISPTATKETIGDLGAFVFQTNLTKDLETRMVARAGVEALQRRRFGILHPAGEEGLALATRFESEVERWGGRVIVVRSYDRADTDFGALLREMRAVAPEALFIPASPSEMRLIAPQLVFQGLRAQLLGPSSWNNGLLVREVGESLDRAVFPSDVALIPEQERARFEQLWDRRFPASPSNSFGLKSYFAAREVIQALDQQSGNTRQRLRDRIEFGLGTDPAMAELTPAPRISKHGLERLRMIVAGRVTEFPVDQFPRLRPAISPPDSLFMVPWEMDLDVQDGRGR